MYTHTYVYNVCIHIHMVTFVCIYIHVYIHHTYTYIRVSGWRSWKKLDLSIAQFEFQLCQTDKNLQQTFNPKLLGLLDRDLNLEASCTTIIYSGYVEYPPLPFTHWASVKAASCCQLGRVAQYVLPY